MTAIVVKLQWIAIEELNYLLSFYEIHSIAKDVTMHINITALYLPDYLTVVFAHLRPLSPPNMPTSAPWLMNRPPHRKAGSSGFPLTGSTKPSTTVSAPWATAFTNALFTWKNGRGLRQVGGKAKCHWLLFELTCGCACLPGAEFCPSAASPPECRPEGLWLPAAPHSSQESMLTQ